MALDALFITRLAGELDELLSGARVDKVHQPERDEIVLALRSAGTRGKKLLLSANASFPRVHMTSRTRENPQSAPMFCMLLRKHLTNGKILSVSAPSMERIIDISLEVNDEMGVLTKRTLTVELMGRHSNIILRDEDDRIIECLKRVDLEMSMKRQVLPGLFYELPPKQEKLNIADFRRAELFEIICNEKSEIPAEKWLLGSFLGMSPLLCREIAFRVGGDTSVRMSELDLRQRERMASELCGLASGESEPSVFLEDKNPYEFSFIRISQYEGRGEIRLLDSLSDTLEMFYETRDARENIRRRAQSILQTVKNAKDRLLRKLALQAEELSKAEGREELRERAELICANIYRLEKGMSSFEVDNYFKEGMPKEIIKLDISKTPQENSEKLFHDYRRMKNAEKYLTEQMAEARAELEYLETVLESVDKAENESDLAEIREELCETGYIDVRTQKKDRRAKPLRPYRFVSSEGINIYAGRNNKQNDMLTLKSAMKGDLWLHTKNVPGSHVIVEGSGDMPPDRTLTEAAIIAAYYSKAKNSENVPVDYTQVRNVKKPSGAAPGKVIYTNSYTAYVTPDEELVMRLLVKE